MIIRIDYLFVVNRFFTNEVKLGGAIPSGPFKPHCHRILEPTRASIPKHNHTVPGLPGHVNRPIGVSYKSVCDSTLPQPLVVLFVTSNPEKVFSQ